LDGAEVVELGRLYRATTSDLAFARGRGYDRKLTEYLNRLTARAHAYVYGGSVESGTAWVARFYGQSFPREFRASFAYVAICIAITVVCSVVAYVIVRTHPGQAYALLPKELVPSAIQKSLHDSNFGFDRWTSPEVAAEIIFNNVRISFLAFAGSVTLGAGTIYIIAYNGLMVGGVGALYTNAGFGYDFWATVAPHGVIELTAIQIAGGAGLLVAAGVLFPGRLRRRDAIKANARRAATLIWGVASMLLVAGTIEGFISPQRWPPQTRIAIGAVTGVFLIFYFLRGGRHATS
jgi:uncharacterized membrane protein SpoIIM required for sporulation